MAKTTSVFCLECDHEHDCEVVQGEFEDEDYIDVPGYCEVCWAPLDGGNEPSCREDFHADG